MDKLVYYLLSITAITLTLGCGSSKSLIIGKTPSISENQLQTRLASQQIDFDWFASKAGVNFKSSTESTGGTLYLRMKKDSMIWAVFKKHSVEVTRMLMTPDSFFILYRQPKTYESGKLRDLQSYFGMDVPFPILQQFLAGNSPFNPNSVHIKKEDDYYMITSDYAKYTLMHKIVGDRLLTDRTVYTDSHNEVSVDYDDYQTIQDGIVVAMKRTYHFPFNQGETASLKMEFKDIKFEKPKRTIFYIPDGYVKLE